MQLFEPPNAVYLTEAFSSTRAASAQSGSPKGEKKIPWFPGGPNQVARQGPWETNSAGDASRLRQDLASGALHYVAECAKLKNNARHVVNAALRKGVCNAYAAHVSQVCQLPQDEYALALYGLDRSLSGNSGRVHDVDFNLEKPPFANSKQKHAAIYQTARRILHSMDGYVSDAAAYCPGEVDALHDPRLTARPSSTRSPGRDTARARTPHAPLPRAASRGRDGAPGTDAKGASSSLDPNPHADNVGPTPARHTPTTPARAASKQARKVTHRPRMAESSDASPSESSSPDDTPPKQRGQAGLQQRAHGFQPKQTHGSHGSPRRAEMVQDPYTGVWTQKGFEAAVGYPVSSLLDEPDQLQGSTGHGSSPLRQRTGLESLTSPGMFVKTAPHYRVAKFYDHVKPSEEVLRYMRLHGKQHMPQSKDDVAVQQMQEVLDATADVPTGEAQGVAESLTPEQQRLLDKMLGPQRMARAAGSSSKRYARGGMRPAVAAAQARSMRHTVPVTGRTAADAAASSSAAAAGGGVGGQDAAEHGAFEEHTPPAAEQGEYAAPPEGVLLESGGQYAPPPSLRSVGPVEHIDQQVLRVLGAAKQLKLLGSLGLEPEADNRSRRLQPSDADLFYMHAYASGGNSQRLNSTKSSAEPYQTYASIGRHSAQHYAHGETSANNRSTRLYP